MSIVLEEPIHLLIPTTEVSIKTVYITGMFPIMPIKLYSN
jgi:hypothetical protein